MQYDVIVIGGSCAGMAAALQLVRARRSLLVLDAGERRNRFAAHSHGFLGQDGVPPGEIAASARRQLERYPTLAWRDGRAESVTGNIAGFAVAASGGESCGGRRILLATGVADKLPAIDGLAERWGKSVFHCPYCHAMVTNSIRAASASSRPGPCPYHQAEMLVDWGDVTVLVNDAVALSPEAATALEQRGVTMETVPIDRIEGHADVVLADGRRLRFAGLFTAPRTSPSSPLAEALGCALEDVPMGMQVRIDAGCMTSVPGVFACGDLARAPHSVSRRSAAAPWPAHRSTVRCSGARP